MKNLRSLALSAGFALATTFGTAQASTLWVGYDTNGPVQQWTTGGAFIGTFGQAGATGTALDGAGHAYTVAPGASDSVIQKYNASQTSLATIHFTTGIDNGNGDPSWIEDMAFGAGNTLWLSGFNGIIYNTDLSGNILSHFDSGHTFSGVALNGSHLFTSDGFASSDNIYERDLTGAVITTIHTAITGGIGGLAYDTTDNTLWAGTFNTIYHLDLTGATLGTLSLPGNFHDGLEIGDIGGAHGVPEPATLALFGAGLAGLGAMRRRRKTQR